jgi:type IV secretion system protein VirD4
MKHHFVPADVGWHLGRSQAPRGVDLWVPYDRTAGVYGPQGSGKTLDLLTPALLDAAGAALVTLTKLDDLLLTLDQRRSGGRPVAVLDPFGVAPGVPELVWDPVAGCVDSMLAERRAKAFTAGTVKGAVAGGFGDDAARFYAAEGAKVLQAFFHAAALTGRTLDHVLEWVADPKHATEPEEILRTHPHAATFWDGLLRGALHGDDRTAGNTATTVQQSMALFFQEPIRRRCVPGPGRAATDIEDLIGSGGTVYLLGRDDPYASASPLMTAIAEHVLDTALHLANTSPHGRLCPSFLACLDELPSTTPLPTLRTRMANERALGLSFIYAAQTWRQLVICYGEDEARALFGLTNNIVVFGGGKDGHFYREISELIGTARVARTTYSSGRGGWGKTTAGEDVPILRPEEIRQLPERQALVVSENARPLIAKLHRCIDGKHGRALLAAQNTARDRVTAARNATTSLTDRTRNAVSTARQLALHPTDTGSGRSEDRKYW